MSVNPKLVPGHTEGGGGLGQVLRALPAAPVYLFPGHTGTKLLHGSPE